MANLEAAVRAYRESQRAVERAEEAAAARVKAARDERTRKRLALADAIVEAIRDDGMRQVDVVSVTGYSREQVRTILRAAGVESDR